MATSVSRVSGLLTVAAVVVTLGNVTACTPKPNGPEPTAEQFFAALATGDTATAAELSDRPADARQALNDAWAGLQATHLDAQILSSKYAEDTGSVTYRYTWHLPKDRTWTYDGQLNLVRDEGRWEVRWSTTGLHPKLGVNQTLALRADPPRRASVNERGGSDVLVPGYLYNFSLDAQAAGGALMPTSRAVVDALRPFDNTLVPQLLAEQASSSKQPLSLITLRQSDHDQVAAAIGALPGVVITAQAELLPTDETFAPAIIGEVKKSVVDELDGRAGWRVVSVNQNGVDVDVLNEVPGEPAPSVTISLDRAVQDAAQNAVNTTGKQAMIVAIKPSTGEILAVAQNSSADAQGPLATTGLFPPGSTFKMITAGAAVERDMATPNTLLACPGTMDIGHRTVPNYGGFDLGTVPMSRAFASSCNTTFAELASRMPPRGLTMAAAKYGIGRGLRDRWPDHGDRLGAADGEPGRTHRGRLRAGQGRGQPVRDGAGRRDRRGRENPCAATDRRPTDGGDRRPDADQPEDARRPAADDAVGRHQRHGQGSPRRGRRAGQDRRSGVRGRIAFMVRRLPRRHGVRRTDRRWWVLGVRGAHAQGHV